jgi:hypothetical protein
MDELGPIEIEFLINNPQLVADAKKAEQTLTGVSDAVQVQCAEATTAINEVVTGTSANTSELEKNIEQLTTRVKLYQAAIEQSFDPTDIARWNAKLEETVAQIERVRNIGKEGFDAMGNAIVKETGLVEQLNIQYKALQQSLLTATSIGDVSKINAQLESTKTQITQLSNAGKTGFDEFGNAIDNTVPKAGKLQSAITRVTNLGNVGARVITQFSRQIIGLGVGLLSAEVGAKAIESLVTYISKLNIFNPVAKEAEIRAKAFGQAFATADYSKAVESITQLRVDLGLARDGFLDKDNVIDEYNRTLGKVAGNVDTLTEAEKGLQANADNFIKMTLLKAASQIILADAAKDAAETAIKNQKLQDDADRVRQENITGQKSAAGFLNFIKQGGAGKSDDQLIKDDQKQIDENNARLKQGYDRRLSIIQNFDKQQAALQKGFGQNTGAGDGGTDVSAIETLRTKLANDALEAKKINAQATIADDQKSYAVRLKAIYDFYNASKGIATNNEKLALTDKKLSADQKLHIENEYNNNVLSLQKTRSAQIQSLQNSDVESEKRKQELLTQISAAEDGFNRKSLSQDQAALTAVSDKYDDLKKKVAEFNADPKNKNNKIGSDTVDKLNSTEFAAISNQADLNENTYIQQDLEKKKQLYAEYEQYREKLGDTAAAKEYADLLKSGQSFQSFVEALQNSLSSQQGDLSPAAFDERKKLYDKFAQEAQKQQSTLNLQMLAQSMDFGQKSNLIIENTIRDAAKLQADGHTKEAETRLKQGEAELDQLNVQNAETVESYKTLADSLTTLTKHQAELRIQAAEATAKAEFAAGTISADKYREIIALIKQAAETIKGNTIAQGLSAIGGALQQIGQASELLDKGFADTITDIGKTISAVATLQQNIQKLETAVANYKTDKSDNGGGFLGTVSTIASAIPIVGSVISGVVGIVTGVINFFKAAKTTAVQSAAELVRYQGSLISGQVAYNELLREQAAVVKDINDLNAKGLFQQQQLLSTQTQQAQADYNNLLQVIQAQGQQVTGEHTEKYGGFLGIAQKTKVVQDLAGLGGADYNQLLQLYTEGKLTDSTKAWFEQLQKVHDEMGSISDQTDQINQQLAQIFTGTTADDLSTAILNGLKAGKRGFSDFSSDFTGTIQDAISSAFESSYLKDKVATFYAEFAKLSETGTGLSSADIAQLKKDYTDLINGASTEYQNLFKITGIASPTGGAATGSSATLSGAIKGITEDQANALEGSVRGIQLAVVSISSSTNGGVGIAQNQLEEMRKQTLTQMQIAQNTRETADNTADMRDSLKNIDKNTADSTGAILRGAGITKI